jgi:hypothetical protein
MKLLKWYAKYAKFLNEKNSPTNMQHIQHPHKYSPLLLFAITRIWTFEGNSFQLMAICVGMQSLLKLIKLSEQRQESLLLCSLYVGAERHFPVGRTLAWRVGDHLQVKLYLIASQFFPLAFLNCAVCVHSREG